MAARRSSNTSATRHPAVRTEYASDRSPLQKLEVALDSLTKEEKRSRMEEAEARAQERAAARRRAKAPENRDNRTSQPSRRSKDYSETAQPSRDPSNRSSGNRTSYHDTSTNSRPSRIPRPEDTDPARRARADLYADGARFRDDRGKSGSAGKHSASNGASITAPARQRSVREGQVFDADPAYTDTRGNLVSPPARTGQADYGFPNTSVHRKPVHSGAEEHNGRVLSSGPDGREQSRQYSDAPRAVRGQVPHQQRRAEAPNRERPRAVIQQTPEEAEEARRVAHMRAAALDSSPEEPPSPRIRQRSQTHDQPVDEPTTPKLKRRFTNPFSRKKDTSAPDSPATAGSGRGKATMGTAAIGGAALERASTEHHHRHPHLHHREDARRYQPLRYADYRKNIRAARVAVDEPEPTVQQQREDAAWWEKNATSKSKSRRSSAGASSSSRPPAMAYDGPYDEGGQTFFNPPLYLKSGPLLRFTGIRKDSAVRPASRSRPGIELWTGSIMIVTVDSKSKYDRPPTLRIFKQPVDLLPPPPVEIDEASGVHLGPEYVDPIAGQIKVSRVGKTLYVKPADALDEHRDLSRVENDSGLFEESRSASYSHGDGKNTLGVLRYSGQDGEKRGKYQEIPGFCLHSERGATFWKFNLEIELGPQQLRLAYRINRGPAIGFWVPARGATMNMMFHSCNGFSLSVDSNTFSGPDPMWRDVLNSHQTRPFHVMLGGGDQIYNDAATTQTRLFGEWSRWKNQLYKNAQPFSAEMQDELEEFYLNRYATWFSQGLFGMATSQIPMVNMWDDHDIIDGFGSYPDRTMSCPVMSGVGNVAFKYYMLFQHQALPLEDQSVEPSWLLGAQPGPYINELSRSVYMSLGRQTALLALDCRTERTRDEILSQETWDIVFDRLRREIVKGETTHLLVVLGIPIAYPRLNFLENVLTSRLMDPLKALGRTGALGGFVNKFDGGVEILDDLDDHWTAKHHKDERNWFVQELQELAAEKSVRITMLGGDVHLCAAGQFYSNKKLGIPKDQDHRYMPNIISSAIVNTPPSDMVADVLNKRNKIHHLDDETDEDMIPIFLYDVNDKPRNNHHLLPRRNWCSIREYIPESTPPATPDEVYQSQPSIRREPSKMSRRSSLTRGNSLIRRLSSGGRREGGASHPPIAYAQHAPSEQDYFNHRDPSRRRASAEIPRNTSVDAGRRASADIQSRNKATGLPPVPMGQNASSSRFQHDGASMRGGGGGVGGRPNPFLRRPTEYSPHNPDHMINLQHALDIRLNVENEQGDPAGTTTEYRLLVPTLDYRGDDDRLALRKTHTSATSASANQKKGGFGKWFGSNKERGQVSQPLSPSGSERSYTDDDDASEERYYNNDGKTGRRRDSLSPPEVIPSGAIFSSHIPPATRRNGGVPPRDGRISVSGPPALGGSAKSRFRWGTAVQF
ncbi:metallo-dependent phosphatase [Venturia nashicola]|nr:metallo-dependent phosphatase [Venturia nashicola]